MARHAFLTESEATAFVESSGFVGTDVQRAGVVFVVELPDGPAPTWADAVAAAAVPIDPVAVPTPPVFDGTGVPFSVPEMIDTHPIMIQPDKPVKRKGRK